MRELKDTPIGTYAAAKTLAAELLTDDETRSLFFQDETLESEHKLLERIAYFKQGCEIQDTGGGCEVLLVPVEEHAVLGINAEIMCLYWHPTLTDRWDIFADDDTEFCVIRSFDEGREKPPHIKIASQNPLVNLQTLLPEIASFEQAAYRLLELWYTTNDGGLAVEGYPFAEAFEETCAKISAWRAKQQEILGNGGKQ